MIAFDPAFITPQDRHDQQGCEQARNRWVKGKAVRFASWVVTILIGDLHGHRILCELLLEHELHFIMTCKVDSHQTLYEEVELLTRVDDAVQTMSVQRWSGRSHERWDDPWASHTPIRTGAEALRVNWCEVTIV